MSDQLGWVKELKTVYAVDTTVVDAMMSNPGWQLLAVVGQGPHGQTTLTFGWGWDDQFATAEEPHEAP